MSALARRVAGRRAEPDRVPRLARDVEVFPASDGSIYLLRGGADADLVIEDAAPAERALLRALRDGSAGELGDGAAKALATMAAHGLLEEAPCGGPSVLSAEERARYDRQLPYFADGEAAQARLRDARVTILGVGGLGSWALCGLACAGVGRVRIVDDDVIDLSNLNRQLLYRRADVGRRKVEVAAEAVAAFNPAIEVDAIAARVSGPADAARAIDGADIAVVTADWPIYELPRWVDRACLAAGVPWIGAGQVPPLVRVGPMQLPGRSACLECQERAARQAQPLYDELARWRQDNPTVATTLGWASGVVGALLAGEVVHLLTGAAEPATLGAAITLDLRTLRTSRERVERDPACPACSLAHLDAQPGLG
jgi:bacteriocin biosynthesis cyclodehydratase domain-containing protein